MNQPKLSPIDQFRLEVMQNVALHEIELQVVDVHGRHPVVVALADETVRTLALRLHAVGGYANLFVRDGDSVEIMPFLPATEAFFADDAEDLTRPGSVSLDASVGMLLECARTAPHGVRVAFSDDATGGVRAEHPREVAFA